MALLLFLGAVPTSATGDRDLAHTSYTNCSGISLIPQRAVVFVEIKVIIPLQINGKKASYRQKNKLSVRSEEKPETEMNGMERRIFSDLFARVNFSVSGCSKKFIERMQDLQLENVARSNPFSGIEIKRKRFSSKYKMKWKI